jgi:hypothetical protein
VADEARQDNGKGNGYHRDTDATLCRERPQPGSEAAFLCDGRAQPQAHFVELQLVIDEPRSARFALR